MVDETGKVSRSYIFGPLHIKLRNLSIKYISNRIDLCLELAHITPTRFPLAKASRYIISSSAVVCEDDASDCDYLELYK